jgi:voltage-gated potassium channel
MKDLNERHPAEHLGVFDVLTLIFSVYVLVALFIQATAKLSPETAEILDQVDLLVCVVFLADFFVRFHRAPVKGHFLKWN